MTPRASAAALSRERRARTRRSPPPSAAPRDEGLSIGAIASYSIAGAGLLAAAIVGPLAWSERDTLVTRCAPACGEADLATAQTLGISTDVALGISATAAVTGTVLAVVSLSAPAAPVVVAPSVSSEHAGLVVGGRF